MSLQSTKLLIEKHERRLQKLKEQQAAKGLDTPAHILTEIEDIEAAIEALQAGLAVLDQESTNSEATAEQQPSDPPGPTELVQIQLLDERPELTDPRQKRLIETVAEVCRLSLDDIRLLGRKPGLWVCLAMPLPAAEQLVERFKRHEPLLPLQTEFRVGDIDILPVQLPQTGMESLAPPYRALVRQLYLGAGRVIIQNEFGGGFGGAQVLLAQPLNQQGKPLARQIIKIGRGLELQREYDNSVQLVEQDLPLVAARLTHYAEWTGLVGLTYTFMGDGMLGATTTFEDYYQDPQVSTEAIIQTLRILLDEALGQSWYRFSTPHVCFFADEYGPHLAAHLHLRLRPASADGIWPAEQAPPIIKYYEALTADEIVPRHRDIAPGRLVQLGALVVGKIKPNELKLHHPSQPGVVVKVAFEPDSEIIQNLALGHKIIVRGELLHNRQQHLEDIVGAAFAGFAEAPVDVKQKELVWGPQADHYPNPLILYPKVLDQTLNGRQSRVHGDLHLRNILVDQQQRPWLIDFALVKERHNLYDFIKLETYIRQMVLSQPQMGFSFEAYLQFEAALTATSLGRDTEPPAHPALQKAYQVIQSLRQIAARYMNQPADFYGEYWPALFLYNLAVLKYHPNHGHQAARLAFATATVVGRALTQDTPKTASSPQEPKPRSPLSPLESTEQEEKPPPPQPNLSPEDEAFLREQLAQHQQNWRNLERQISIFGVGNTPLHLINQITYEKEEIRKIKELLGD